MRAGSIFWIVTLFLFASSVAGAGRGKKRQYVGKKDTKSHRPTSSKDPGFPKHNTKHWDHKEPTQPAPIPPPPPRNDRKLNGAENTGTVLMNDSQSSVQNDSKNSDASCPHGWKGESCSESLYCIIITPAEALDIDKERELGDSMNFGKESENFWTAQRRPKCLSTCDISVALHGSAHYAYRNISYYIVPINSACNIETDSWIFLKIHKYLITGGLAIISLLILIICILCMVLTKWKLSTTKNDKPVESEYDDVCSRRPLSGEPMEYKYDYVYDHQRVLVEAKNPEYDDVWNCQSLPEEPTKLEYDYVYDHRWWLFQRI